MIFEIIKQKDLLALNSVLFSFPNLNIIDEETELPLLTYAVEEQWIEGVEALLKAGANVEFSAGCEDKALVSAVELENKKIIELLLEYGANPDAPFSLDIPLQEAVGKENIEIIKILIEAGANINSRDVEGYSSLMSAVCTNRFDIVKILVEQGANINQFSRYRTTALTIASEEGYCKIYEYLSSIIMNNKTAE